ncbi:MAG: hypothetical protein C4538_02190 [Nitrospiraceae bacterium]|nr:MAG: hypothetical protein C4538_02190 [Nitrospiraceae bacterium]
MPKKIAVLARERQCEAFRMAAGLIMMDDKVDVYVLDRKIYSDPYTQQNLEIANIAEVDIYTTTKKNKGFKFISTEDLAEKLLEYDIIDPY